MRALISVILLCGFVGCGVGHCFSKKIPSNEVEKTEVPSKPPIDAPILDAYEGRDRIFAIATKDLCAKAVYKDQGTPPASYLKGLSLTYVKTLCSPDSDVFKTGSKALGSSESDALAHYGLNPSTPTDRLNTVFAMMIGSNARESSWRPCVGRDTTAVAKIANACVKGGGETCEAGLAQTSYDSVPKSGPLRDLFDSFSDYPTGCFKTEYYGSITCSASNWKNYGSNPKAVQFQRMSKECPGYTVEAGVIMFRTNRKHYGPLNRKTAEVIPACVGMFERLRQEVVKDPSLCTAI